MQWDVLTANNDTMLLIVMILLDYFMGQGVLHEQGQSLFRFMLDVALNQYLLQITNFEA